LFNSAWINAKSKWNCSVIVSCNNLSQSIIANVFSIFEGLLEVQMITTTHLIMIRVFLKQEMPPPYNELISIEDDKIVIRLPDNGKPFNDNYDEVFKLVSDNVARIRNRESDLDFSVKATNQLRDFKIYK
jgi:hypothetical protein